MNDCHLTVKDLRKQLEGLPDDMPVYYQRIEDKFFTCSNWKTKEMLWEISKIPEQYRDRFGGEEFYRDMTNYIRAFSSYKHCEENAFVINAHY